MLAVIYVFLKSISNLFEVNICCIVFGQFRVCVKSILPIGLISLVKAKVTLFDVLPFCEIKVKTFGRFSI